MIRLVNLDLEREFNFDNDVIRLYIENEKYFREFILSLKRQIEFNIDGKFVMSEKEKTLDISKNIWLISDLLELDPNDRKVMTKLVQELCNRAQIDYYKYQEFLNEMNNFYNDLLFDFDIELIRNDNFDIKEIIKLGGFSFEYKLENIEEMIINYIKIIRKYLKINLFVFINMEKYFNEAELKIILDDFKQNGFNILLIESGNYAKIDYKEVKNYIIDKDMCEL